MSLIFTCPDGQTIILNKCLDGRKVPSESKTVYISSIIDQKIPAKPFYSTKVYYEI